MESSEEFAGQLSCGLSFSITPSRKKSPGLVTGEHFIAVFKDSELSIPELPKNAFHELATRALTFAEEHAFEPGAYRIAFNGPNIGRRKHAHIHIMLPKDDDVLPTIVETGSDSK